MVSTVEPSQALALRGPASVISRSSRHRRQGRSHAGGSSFIPQNEFPVFSHTGDVEILVTAGLQTNRYLLHKIILAQCSGFFEASTSQEWSRAGPEPGSGAELARIGEGSGSGSESGRTEVKKRWRYELDPGSSPEDIPMLVQKDSKSSSLFGSPDSRPPPVKNKPPSSNPSFFRSVANLSISNHHHTASAPQLTQDQQDLLESYDNLFRIFYNYPPALDPIDIAIAYLQCKSLLNLADLYDALAVVGPRVDHHLLQFQSRLWKQIAKYPSSYLKLGYLAQSKHIFQEALIHVVGAWPMGERHIRHQLPASVLEIIEDKVEDLSDMVARIEGKLFRLTLTTSRGERVTPGNAYLEWLVVSLFRQWLADNTSPPPTPAQRPSSSRNGNRANAAQNANPLPLPLPAPPSTNHPNVSTVHTTTSATPSISSQSLNSSPSHNPNLSRTIRTLGMYPSTYLLHDECKRFLKLSPELYSRENLRRFEKRMEELKGLVRETVKPLMKSYLSGGNGGEVGYLVCTRVGRADLPWNES